MAKPKNGTWSQFTVELKPPLTQRQADAVQNKPGCTGYMLHYRRLAGTRAEGLAGIVFFFSGPTPEMQSVHKKLKRLKSKNIHVRKLQKVPEQQWNPPRKRKRKLFRPTRKEWDALGKRLLVDVYSAAQIKRMSKKDMLASMLTGYHPRPRSQRVPLRFLKDVLSEDMARYWHEHQQGKA